MIYLNVIVHSNGPVTSGGGYYRIKSRYSGKVLDINGASAPTAPPSSNGPTATPPTSNGN